MTDINNYNYNYNHVFTEILQVLKITGYDSKFK